MFTSKKYLYLLFIPLISFSCIKEEITNPHSTPQKNFDLLWQLVDENYCFFEYKNIDWNAVKAKYAPRVTNNTGEQELFNICAAMLNELQDGHVNLYSYFNVSRYWDFFLDYPQNFNSTLVERRYLGNNHIIIGGLQASNINGIGYLRYGDFTNTITPADVRNAINQLGNIQGLIIDVRDNGGGVRDYAKIFASCFFAERTLVGYTRYKEGKGHADYSKYFSHYVDPEGAVAFGGNIVILTNRLCYSATNEFVSMMKCLPNVTLIGDITGGGGGIPFSAELYNGWQLRLSRDPMFDANKHHIENGIEPHIFVDMNKDDEYNNIDSIIEYAVDFLKQPN